MRAARVNLRAWTGRDFRLYSHRLYGLISSICIAVDGSPRDRFVIPLEVLSFIAYKKRPSWPCCV